MRYRREASAGPAYVPTLAYSEVTFMAFDKNPRKTDGDIYVAGKTTEAVVAAYVKAQEDLQLAPHPWMLALRDRFARKADARLARAGADAD